MHFLMHFEADQFIGTVPQHRFGRRIDERRDAVRVDAVDALASRRQDQVMPALDLAQKTLRPPPFAQTRPVHCVGFVVDAAPRLRVDILDRPSR